MRRMAVQIPNGNGGELRARVTAVELDVNHIETHINSIRETMATKSDIDRISNSIASIAQAQAIAAKPQWAVMLSAAGLIFTFIISIGAFAYWPIRDTQVDLKKGLADLSILVVGRLQYDRDQARVDGQLKSLHEDVNITVQQQRYNADQARLTEQMKRLEETGQSVLRNTSRLEEAAKTAEKNIDILFTRNYKLATEPNLSPKHP